MRIFHISDLHIVPKPGEEIYGVDSFESLRRVLDEALVSGPDLIVATGDLTERGDSESYQRLRGLLGSTGLPVFAIPGNHDSPRRIASDLIGGLIQHVDLYDHAGWRLVFLNSRVSGAPHGEISAEQSQKLDESLREAGDRHVLVALHHTPISPCPSFGCQLRGASDFLLGLSEHGNVRAVIAGHSHIEANAGFEQIQVMTTPSTCAEAIHEPAGRCRDLTDFWASHHFDPSRHGYRMIELGVDGTFTSTVHWVDNPAEVATP